MIVPKFWAEGRIQERVAGQQLTVRRFGWSDESPVAAQAHADRRTLEAFERIAAGEKLERRERKLAYNGAEGVPIREEIVAQHGDTIVTRNGYGARCLNTPEVLFVDIDFEEPSAFAAGGSSAGAMGPALVAAVLVGLAGGWAARSWVGGLLAAVIVFVLVYAVMGARKKKRGRAGIEEVVEVKEAEAAPAPEQRARERIARFIEQHPDWNLRIYRTPAGLRALAMHAVFSPADPAVADCFQLLGVDKVYARMCRNQNCFRARLSAKPWRIGIGERMRPRPGIWPVAPDKLAARDAWVARYEKAAEGHAACRFLEAVGSATVHPSAAAVQALHDEQSRALSGLPLA
jgi:hypothetical protein